jgi:hypothetical protein
LVEVPASLKGHISQVWIYQQPSFRNTTLITTRMSRFPWVVPMIFKGCFRNQDAPATATLQHVRYEHYINRWATSSSVSFYAVAYNDALVILSAHDIVSPSFFRNNNNNLRR